MATLRWFLEKMKQPEYVDKPTDDYLKGPEEEEVDSIVPTPPAPAPNPEDKALNPNAVNAMATQMWGEGMGTDTLENMGGVENPVSQERFPYSKKLKYAAKMKRQGENQFDLEPLPTIAGGAFSPRSGRRY